MKYQVTTRQFPFLRKCALGILPFLLTCGVTSAATDRPNILFILADDLGWKDVGFHGGNAPTPNLDRLAATGLELTQHYTYTVCSAARASLLTGRYSTRFGFAGALNHRALPWDTITLPLALRSAGYESALAGKWHLGSKPEWGPQHYGFDYSYGSFAGGVGPWDHTYKRGQYARTWHRNGEYVEETGHVTDLLTREGVRWIEERGEKPFFLYMPYTAPHVPIREPEEYLRRVPAGIIEPSRREYAAALIHLDDAIGDLLDALRRTGKWENTIVVFTSDNGATPNNPNFQAGYLPDNYAEGPAGGDNSPFRGSKGNVYEGGIRVPTVISWPGRLNPGKFEEPVHMIDWMPTFCSLAGFRPKKNLRWDGINIFPALTGAATLAPRPLYWEAPAAQAQQAVRLGDWKLVVHQVRPEIGGRPPRSEESIELYNLASDPGETADLAARRPEKVQELLKVLELISEADGDAIAND